MVLPTSAVAFAESFLPFELQPVEPSRTRLTPSIPSSPDFPWEYTRMVPRFVGGPRRHVDAGLRLRGYLVDSVGHSEFTATIQYRGFAGVEHHRLVGPVHDDVVDHVVGDDDVRGALNRDAPTTSLGSHVVSRAHYEERGIVAVQGLNDALTGDVGVAVLRLRRGCSNG